MPLRTRLDCRPARKSLAALTQFGGGLRMKILLNLRRTKAPIDAADRGRSVPISS